MQPPPLDSDEIRLLTEVGMVLAGAGKTAPAVRLFDALAGLRPTRAFPYVGKAMALINAERAEEAVATLRHALPLAEAEAPTLQAFLGFALHLAGHSAESQRQLARAAQADASIDGVRLARHMLGLENGTPAGAASAPPPLPAEKNVAGAAPLLHDRLPQPQNIIT